MFFTSATATPAEVPSSSEPTPGAMRATTAVALAVPLVNGAPAVCEVSPDAVPQVPTSSPADAMPISAVRP